MFFVLFYFCTSNRLGGTLIEEAYYKRGIYGGFYVPVCQCLWRNACVLSRRSRVEYVNTLFNINWQFFLLRWCL